MKRDYKLPKKKLETRRTIEFGETAQGIQTDANNNCDGNFTEAIKELAVLGLKARKKQNKLKD